jgi:single-strand DNA-binding protein
MAYLNKVVLIGSMTRDTELRYTPRGTPLADISVAINRVTGGGESGNERREEVIFVDVTLWGRLAEIVAEFGGKGKPLFVEGRLHLDTWEDKTTHQKRSRLKVVAENIQLLGSPRGGAGNGKSQERGASHSQRHTGASVDPELDPDEPF